MYIETRVKGRERLKERGGGRERERDGGKACQKHVSKFQGPPVM